MPATHDLQFEPLPIDNAAGFPQRFSHLFGGALYHFFLYANLPAERLAEDPSEFFDLPSSEAHLAVQVERDLGDGERLLLLARKVVPGIRYASEDIVLEFPSQRIARTNINGQGEAGSQVSGRIASR